MHFEYLIFKLVIEHNGYLAVYFQFLQLPIIILLSYNVILISITNYQKIKY